MKTAKTKMWKSLVALLAFAAAIPAMAEDKEARTWHYIRLNEQKEWKDGMVLEPGAILHGYFIADPRGSGPLSVWKAAPECSVPFMKDVILQADDVAVLSGDPDWEKTKAAALADAPKFCQNAANHAYPNEEARNQSLIASALASIEHQLDWLDVTNIQISMENGMKRGWYSTQNPSVAEAKVQADCQRLNRKLLELERRLNQSHHTAAFTGKITSRVACYGEKVGGYLVTTIAKK